MQNVTHRFKLVMEHYKPVKSHIETAIGASNGFLSKALDGTDIGISWIEKISTQFPNVNYDWLITGRGEMLLQGQGVAAPVAVAAHDGALLAENIELLRENRQLRIVIERMREGKGEG